MATATAGENGNDDNDDDDVTRMASATVSQQCTMHDTMMDNTATHDMTMTMTM